MENFTHFIQYSILILIQWSTTLTLEKNNWNSACKIIKTNSKPQMQSSV